MSYTLQQGARASLTPLFRDFKLARLWEGPGKVAHLFVFGCASVPFYLFSSAYRASVDNRTFLRKRRNVSSILFLQISCGF